MFEATVDNFLNSYVSIQQNQRLVPYHPTKGILHIFLQY
jgi:hypothetical protein